MNLRYSDHTGLWEKELKSWVPEKLFDAHVHLGPPEAVGQVSPERLKVPSLTFTNLKFEELNAWYEKLYSSKTVDGLIAFPFPLQEVNMESANRYIIDIMQKHPEVKGFIWSDPASTKQTIKQFNKALEYGVRFSGVKPHFDILRKSNYDTTMPEILPQELLEFMNSESLIMMLHTTGVGMSDKGNQEFAISIAKKFLKIKVILAHMGRFLRLEQFSEFMQSGVMDYPSIFLETSSVTIPKVYEMVLNRKELWSKVLFGSDVPFGLITGVEYCEGGNPAFITRDRYSWSEAECCGNNNLTYNTYHMIKALKDAIKKLELDKSSSDKLKNDIFRNNSKLLFKKFDFSVLKCQNKEHKNPLH